MGIRKDQLWVVPVFCIGAGIATHIVYFAAHFLVWIASYPDDGWVNVYDPLVFGGCFLAALLLGGLCFFRDMTRKELFVSVSIVALYGAAVYTLEWMDPSVNRWGPARILGLGPLCPFGWLTVVDLAGPLGRDGVSQVVKLLLPYLFVLFGRREKKPC
ncbi:MAG: hypothetical protein HFF68_03175 [Oscillospiraceae bacterium]|nr:hypothetical protein [Oscillospiraceae bacterium]